MSVHIQNRDEVIEKLQRELVGPDPSGTALVCVSPPAFESWEHARGPFIDAETREEILHRDRPCRRYGVGVLYPGAAAEDWSTATSTNTPDVVEGDGHASRPEDPSRAAALQERIERTAGIDSEYGLDDLDISSANDYRPSTMGVSFLVRPPSGTRLVVEVRGGRYKPLRVTVGDKPLTWWVRRPVHVRAEFDASSLLAVDRRRKVMPAITPESQGADGLSLSIEVHARRAREGGQVLVTACVINRGRADGAPDEHCLFQSHLCAYVMAENRKLAAILPYPAPPGADLDKEEEEIALLYRDVQTFAVGHGGAGEWKRGDASGDEASEVSCEPLPAVELPSITPSIRRPDGGEIEVDMRALAGLEAGDDGLAVLEEIVSGYERWIGEQDERADRLKERYRAAAGRHLALCKTAASRMRDGLRSLENGGVVAQAFQLANHAMLLQQARTSSRKRREAALDEEGVLSFTPDYEPPGACPANRGKWRPFQIAFLLMNLRSFDDPGDDVRETVELIWFPTGGGKTEAYLGLAAFAMLLRRLRGLQRNLPREDAGVEVIMRYTLRLLTAQQFQRTAALICAMDYLRQQNSQILGKSRFALGLWVGGTPNTREQARAAHRQVCQGEDPGHNIIILDRCPWCRAQMGLFESRAHPEKDGLQGKKRRAKKAGLSRRALGYSEQAVAGSTTVRIHCPDRRCTFYTGLPLEFIDDDLYDACTGSRPVSMIIGTVDKFAMLAWRPHARVLFGRDSGGQQIVGPPGLVLQDELHLISGPLGSMVGLYETVIEELCTDRRRGREIKPKIVTSTATIRAYREQIRDLFARRDVLLFPPPGLDAGESYFSSLARDERGKLMRGRVYLGVYAPGLGSLQTTQVRTFSALLQAPAQLPADERDPWWTLLSFYNSIRELGGGLTLFFSDIPEYVQTIRRRHDPSWQARWPDRVEELMGGLSNDRVTRSISLLEQEYEPLRARGQAIDACLASNIIEVGVDIDRLSLMAVVGQPKSTAQYIQVTGRVGRKWQERPGLVVTLYSASKPRDRSHYEKFRAYHERLYAQVEPTSVTPFSRPSLERALHALIATLARQTQPWRAAEHPNPYPDVARDLLQELLSRRLAVAKGDGDFLANLLRRRLEEIRKWNPVHWERPRDDNPPPWLLRWPDEYVPGQVRAVTWSTPTSMRNVDAQCELQVSNVYQVFDGSSRTDEEVGS